MSNRMFDEMLKVAKMRLSGRKAEDISEKSKIEYDKENAMFLVNSMGKKICISYPDYEAHSMIDEWHLLTILHYMDRAEAMPLSGNLTSFGKLKDGIVRGTRFDQIVEMEIEKLLKNKSKEKIENALESMGGIKKNSKADLCMEISFLPMYPLIVNIWLADDEYPTSGKLLLDESSDYYLTIEDAVTVGDVFLRKFAEVLNG